MIEASSWPVEIEQWEYYPVPESWLEHPKAVVTANNPENAAYATSAAKWGQSLRIRYYHPETSQMFGAHTGAAEHNNGLVPEALLSGKGWPMVKEPSLKPIHSPRQIEVEHFEEIWRDQTATSAETETPA